MAENVPGLLSYQFTCPMRGATGIQLKQHLNLEFQLTRHILGCGSKTKKGKETPIVYPDFIAPVLHALCDQSQSKVGKVLCMNEDNFYKQFKQLKERCGIRPEVRPYSGRHYTGTALALQNISASIIMNIMRHTDYATTLNYYTHIPTQTMVDSVNQLPTYAANPTKNE